MNWTVTAERRGTAWVLRCDELPAVLAQVGRLDQVAETMAEVIARSTQTPVDQGDIVVQPLLAATVAQAMRTAEQLREEGSRAISEAARLTRVAAAHLKHEGLTMRDIGFVMGVTPQRANVLASQAADETPAAVAAPPTLFDAQDEPADPRDAPAQENPAPTAPVAPATPPAPPTSRTPTPPVTPATEPQIERPLPAAARTPEAPNEPPAPRRAAPAAVSAPSSRAAAVVVDVQTMHLPDGTTRPTPAIRHLGDLAAIGYDLGLGVQVVASSGQTRGHIDAGTVVVTGDLAAQLGITTTGLPRDGAQRGQAFAAAHLDHPALRDALTDGWRVAEAIGTDIKGWTKMWREGGASVYIAFADLLPPSIRSGDSDPATIARRLGLFAGVLGTAFHVSAHATGSDLMRALRTKRSTEFAVHNPPPPAKGLGDPDITAGWSRQPRGAEADLTYVHAYDRGGAHLAGVAGLELPVGDPVHYEAGLPFDSRVPGYWRVHIPQSADWRYPHPLYKPRYGELDWVTTPALAFAAEVGYELDVVEAYVWPNHARVLDPWYKRLAAARAATDDPTDPDLAAVRAMVKEVYTRSIGMMGSRTHAEGTSMFQPERRHHIVAKARANLLRRVIAIGQSTDVWPLAVKTDTLLYASNEPDPIKAWPGESKHLGLGLGQYKVEGTGLLVDQLPHLDGKSWPDEAKALVTGRTTPDGDE